MSNDFWSDRPIERKRMAKALTKTLRAYEALIANPEKEYKKWNGYGEMNNCRICQYMDIVKCDFSFRCEGCPLDSTNQYCGSEGNYIGSVENLMYELDEFFGPIEDFIRLREVAGTRYYSIIKVMEKNGWLYR